MTLELRFAVRSDVGMVRKGNEDSGYAGPHLLLVADGMGGHAFGEVASSAAVGVLVGLETAPGTDPAGPGPDPVASVREHVARAGDLLRSMIKDRPELEGMGTTVTALVQVDERVIIAQVGDSRGYLLRDGVLEQVTHDQTFVQSLIDEGRISHEAARTHPQRSLLLQALDGRVEVEPDISVRTPQVGDRYMLCSDGLSGVLSEATMREVLMVGTPDEAVDRLVDLALRSGAPDNVTCVVADVAEAGEVGAGDLPAPVATPRLVGAAAEAAAAGAAGAGAAGAGAAGAGAAGAGAAGAAATDLSTDTAGPGGPDGGAGSSDEGQPPGEEHHGARFRLLLPLLLIVAVAAAAVGGYRWTQQQYYVGASNGQIAIYRGLPQHVPGLRLSTFVETSGTAIANLPAYARDAVKATISAKNLTAARTIVKHLQDQAAACIVYPEPAGCAPGLAPTPSPTPTPSPHVTPTPAASPSASKR
jgi:serine/threonine protein phosphatase PrpC